MRLTIILLAALGFAAAPAQAQPDLDEDGGFNERGLDRHDRTPDWNYRRGETPGKGAYYDGGHYGPRGLIGAEAAPWLGDASDAARLLIATRGPASANRWFVRLADRDRDARLTDAEIALALETIGGSAR